MTSYNIGNNIVTANVEANGDILIGSKKVTNLYYSITYKNLKDKLNRLDEEIEEAKSESARNPEINYIKQQLIKLEEKRSKAKEKLLDFIKDVLKIAEEVSKIPINTKRLQSAKNHFEAGEFEKARAVLEAEVEMISSEQDQLLKQKESLTQKLANTIIQLAGNSNEYLMLAHLTTADYTLEDRFSKAIDYYESSLKSERNSRNVYDYAFFLHNHNQLEKASILYTESIEIFKNLSELEPEKFLPQLGSAYNNLGNCQTENYKPDEADKAYKEALDIRWKLAITHSDGCLVKLADSLSNYGNFLEVNNKLEGAERAYRKSMRIYKNLAKANPNLYLPSVAGNLLNEGVLLIRIDARKAISVLQKAIDIYLRFVFTYPELQPKLGITLINLGNAYKESKMFTEAEESNELALEIFEDLASSNPQAYLPKLAGVLMNQTSIFLENQKIEDAEKSGMKALEYFRELAKNTPQNFLPKLASAAKNMSAFYLNYKPNRELSLALAKEAIQAAFPYVEYDTKCKDVILHSMTIAYSWDLAPELFFQECIKAHNT